MAVLGITPVIVTEDADDLGYRTADVIPRSPLRYARDIGAQLRDTGVLWRNRVVRMLVVHAATHRRLA